MNRSSVYRSDFYRALAQVGDDAEARRAICRLWGFRDEKDEREEFLPDYSEALPEDRSRRIKEDEDETKVEARPIEHFPFQRCVRAERISGEERQARNSTVSGIMASPKVTSQKLLEKDGSAPKPPPLMRWSRLGPFLRKILSKQQRSRQPDVRKVVRWLAEGRALLRLPTLAKSKWNPQLVVWQDRRDDLAPYWDDAEFVKRRIIRERGKAGLQWRIVDRDLRSPTGFSLFDPSTLSHEYLLVPRGDAAILVLGDLGQYRGGSLQEAWLAVGRKCSSVGQKAWVLCPCPSHRWAISMTRAWNITQWDRGTRPARQGRGLPPLHDELDAPIRLFRLLASAAMRVEMGLIRQLRFLVPEGDVGLEHELFSSKDVLSNSSGIAFRDDALRGLREELQALSPQMTAECVSRIFLSHGYAPVYRHFELMAWKHWLSEVQWEEVEAQGVITSEQQDQSLTFYRGILHSVRARESGVSGKAMEAFLSRDLGRLDDEAYQEEDRQVAWALTHDFKPGEALPEFIDPEVIRAVLPASECPPVLFHADGLVVGEDRKSGRIPTSLRESDGTCVVSLGHENRLVGVSGQRLIGNEELLECDEFTIANDADKVTVERFTRPAWAKRMWYDRYGLAAEFRVKNVPFVLRWIPPGRFLMGSPEEEPGRFDDEGPQHERVIEKGFWLGETVVTQAQWLAVMGKNPSEFKGPGDLPVEQVSWKDCGDYCEKLNSLVPGLRLRLPEEAEWEYSCRAGTDTALWTGGITIKESYDAPELEDIAWYVGNSWKEPVVENLYDMKSHVWRHPEGAEAGTHAVKGKEANPWGLYDMLGNVWEWCDDVWDAEAYEKFGRGEGLPKGADVARRVVRGGSWVDHAWRCRAAYRLGGGGGPEVRGGLLGFRLAAGQEQGGRAAGSGSDPDG